ncbi:MAG: hypothetical protein Q4D55_11160 [Eubacteriales bacterium]|nr:hypothetical protein [Eubacteriales bacterium]
MNFPFFSAASPPAWMIFVRVLGKMKIKKNTIAYYAEELYNNPNDMRPDQRVTETGADSSVFLFQNARFRLLFVWANTKGGKGKK